MTKEQVAELRENASCDCWDNPDVRSCNCLAQKSLSRLLDEREALLEALKEARRLLAECDTSLGVSDLTAFDAAIAKAESP